jgi:hypothetical protein
LEVTNIIKSKKEKKNSKDIYLNLFTFLSLIYVAFSASRMAVAKIRDKSKIVSAW